MLRNNIQTYNAPKQDDLSVEPKHEVSVLLQFIDCTISGFCPYYQAVKDSDKENRISEFLSFYFNACLRQDPYSGFPPFNFSKNPTQPNSDKETDIGVTVLSLSSKPVTIIEFEAKRFSETSKYKEYVSGVRGGLERFKRGEHASHLSVCGMFGYVQSRTSTEWIDKVNKWIGILSQANTDVDIDWANQDEKLSSINSFPKVEKLKSINKRKKSLNPIILYHYFLELF
jgi:hypothetical protein